MNSLPKNWDSMSLPHLWEVLNNPQEERGAAASTVEAIRSELRSYGLAQLEKPRTQARLAALDANQLADLIASLRRMQPRYPTTITDELIAKLEALG